MNKIIDYVVIHSDDSNELEHWVKSHLKNGWQPYGALAISDNEQILCQAMVKYEEPSIDRMTK